VNISYLNLALEKISGLFQETSDLSVHVSVRLILALLLLVGIIVFASVSNYALSHSFLGSSYRIFVAPGIILHEVAHAFACLITGAKIGKVSFFEKQGGSVTHSHSKIPILGDILISFSPLVFGIVSLYFLSLWLGLGNQSFAVFTLADLRHIQILPTIIDFYRLNFSSNQNIVIFYLALSVCVTMTPSVQDLKNSFLALFVAILVLFLTIRFLPLPQLTVSVPAAAVLLLSSVFFLLILAVVFSIVILMISMIFKRN